MQEEEGYSGKQDVRKRVKSGQGYEKKGNSGVVRKGENSRAVQKGENSRVVRKTGNSGVVAEVGSPESPRAKRRRSSLRQAHLLSSKLDGCYFISRGLI